MDYKKKQILKFLSIAALFVGALILILNLNPFHKSVAMKTTSPKIEKYWEDTEIQLSDLKKYVNDKKCQKKERYFLACVNSLLFALEKTNYHLTVDGEIKENTESNFDNLNEKQKLKEFLNLYNRGLSKNFKFEQLWIQTLELNKSSFKKYLIAYGINGFLSVNADPHTYIGPTAHFIEVASKNEKSKYIVGLTLNKKNKQLIISQISKNSDADLTRLKVNDQILSINGTPTLKMTLHDANSLFRDSTQDSFNLEIMRKNKTLNKVIKRSYRILSQVYGEIIDPEKRIGYIQLSKFNFNVCENIKLELEKMNPHSLKGLILDLRDNAGGLLSEAACLAGLFIGEEKKIFTVKYLDGSSEESQTTSSQLYLGDIVILTNSNSASASELLAGAMQEYKRAVVIGERTFGKGTFQEIERWNNSPNISLYKTQGFYLLPSGESTQIKGVTPDLIVNDDTEERYESEVYQYPLNYKSTKIKKKKSTNKYFSLCNKNNDFSIEDKILEQAQYFLNCKTNLSKVYKKIANKNQ